MFVSSPRLRLTAYGATFVTVAAFGAFCLLAATDSRLFNHLSRKDSFGDTGLFEHLTVALLLPGIVAASWALLCRRRFLPSRWLAMWLLMWTLACVYFAGEEASWGQWYLGYKTIPTLHELNDQGEMNLHNISSWLDQKPRAVVKVFIISAGLILPIAWVLARRRTHRACEPGCRTDEWLSWTLAPPMCWAAAAVVLVQRAAAWIDDPLLQRIGTSEFRELGIAWFLSLYLFSYALRLAAVARGTSEHLSRAKPPRGLEPLT